MNPVSVIAGAVLNSLWQAAALALLVRIGATRLNAATRHLIWWITLAAIVLLPCVPRIALHESSTPEPSIPAHSLPARVAPPFTPPLLEAPVTITDHPRSNWPIVLFVAWTTVLAWRAGRLAREYFQLRGMKSRATVWTYPLPPIRRRTLLLLSDELSSPIAAGFRKPCVILPDSLPGQLRADELDHVLLHEAAHFVRYDDWTNLVARVLDAFLALHPVAWWVLRQIEREREIACDDWVVARTGAAHSYAESLTHIAELKLQATSPALATGILVPRSRLRARIEMLLRRGRSFSAVATRLPLAATAVTLAALAGAGTFLPHWIAFAQRLEFEVASVRRNTANGPVDLGPRRSGDLVIMHNIQPYTAIYYAWHLHGNYQMVGYHRLPEGWNWYDIDARAGRPATDDEIRQMFQSLLEDRFKLQVHRETREIPEYELVLARGKPKLRPSDSQELMNVTIEERTFPTRPGRCGTSLWHDGAHMVCHSAPMDAIVAELSGHMHAPIVDRTGLAGTYDFHVRFIPENARPGVYSSDPSDPGATLPQALQEDLGFKLEKGKGPIEVLVIDHMEKPTEN
jgi:uncharacterized protein (TIGR03435 family)